MSHPTLNEDDTKSLGIGYPPPGQASLGPVLVATDGYPAGEAACRAAALGLDTTDSSRKRGHPGSAPFDSFASDCSRSQRIM